MSKKKNVFSIVSDGDESELYFLNGEEVGQGNHDDHGWAGMASMRELIESIAEVLGAEVTDEDPRQ